MSDNMIERVARAINDRTKARIFARAAIEAMRETTQGMLNATDGHDNYWGYEADGRPNGPYACYQAMIDAALQEKPE